MSIKYTPTRDEVRERFIDGFPFDTWVLSRDRIGQDYDRYEAARDAEQQRIGAVKALREAADNAQEAFVAEQAGMGFARVRTDWLRKEADRIEQEGKTDER